MDDLVDAIEHHARAVESVAEAICHVATELRGIGQELGPGGHKSLGNVFEDLVSAVQQISPS